MPSLLRRLCCGMHRRSHSASPEAPSSQYRLSQSATPPSTVPVQPLRGLEVVYDGTKSCQPDSNGAYRTTITIKNPNPRETNSIIFKIMINVHNVYVRPNRGLLMPGDLLTVQVRRDDDSKSAEKHSGRKVPRLMVKSTLVPPELLRRYGEHNLVDIWNRIERDGYRSYETWCIRLPTPPDRPGRASPLSAPSITSVASAWNPNGNNPNSESVEIARLRQENAQLREHVVSMQNGPQNGSTVSLYPIVSNIGTIGPRYYPPPPPQVGRPLHLDQSSLANFDMDYFDAPVPSYEEATGRQAGIRRLPPI